MSCSPAGDGFAIPLFPPGEMDKKWVGHDGKGALPHSEKVTTPLVPVVQALVAVRIRCWSAESKAGSILNGM